MEFVTYKDEIEISQLIEHNTLAYRDSGQTSYGGQGQLHVLVLLQECVVGSDCGGDGLDVEEKGSIVPRDS